MSSPMQQIFDILAISDANNIFINSEMFSVIKKNCTGVVHNDVKLDNRRP